MTTRLHFSPAFDSCCLVPDPQEGTSVLDERYIGPSGLLEELELRAGLTSRECSTHELVSRYCAAAKRAAASEPDLFFANSISTSPISTAEEMLRWRDELIFSGWDGKTSIPDGLTSGAEGILKGLGAIEAQLKGFRSRADRWREIIALVASEAVIPGAEIILHCDRSTLHPVYARILAALESHGTKITPISILPAHETKILRFKDSVDACLWTAVTKKDDTDTLLICSDNVTLSTAMKAAGCSDIASSSAAQGRPVEHMFVSLMMLLRNPCDLVALRDYLSSPSHPLGRFSFEKDGSRRVLRTELLSHIVAQNGTGRSHASGKTFTEVISEFAAECGVDESEIMAYLPAEGEKLTLTRIKQQCEALSAWCSERLNSASAEDTSRWASQWASVKDSCGAMAFMLDQSGTECDRIISDNEFMSALRYSGRAKESILSITRKGSAPVIASPEGIASDIRDAIWVDASNTGRAFPLQFLCDEDISTLKTSSGLDMQTRKEALLSDDAILKAGLSHVMGTLTILACDSFKGEKRQRHPYLIEGAAEMARTQGKKVLDYLDTLPYEQIPDENAVKIPVTGATTQQLEYCIDELKGMALPDHESPSSLETLFERPFDHVVSSVLGLREESDSNLSNIMGTVAHETISRLYQRGTSTAGNDVSADEFEKQFQAHCDEDFEASVKSSGILLSLPENSIERKQLHYSLKTRSIPKLIEILRYSGLTIVGSEVESKKTDISMAGYEPLCITATIDLLLRNRVGHYFIIDFKWTSGQTGVDMRTAQIKKGEDYQLALYRCLCEKGTDSIPKAQVDGQAFFMLKTAEVLTAYCGLKDSKGDIEVIQPGPRTHQLTYDETIAEIQQKYSDFARDLRNGKLKEGEGMTGADGNKIKDRSYGENLVLKGKVK